MAGHRAERLAHGVDQVVVVPDAAADVDDRGRRAAVRFEGATPRGVQRGADAEALETSRPLPVQRDTVSVARAEERGGGERDGIEILIERDDEIGALDWRDHRHEPRDPDQDRNAQQHDRDQQPAADGGAQRDPSCHGTQRGRRRSIRTEPIP